MELKESTKEVKRRRWIVLSVALFSAILGIPLWYYTTSIYRAPLNYTAMSLYDTSLPSLIDVEIPVYLRAAGTSLPDIVPATQILIDRKLKENGIQGWRLKLHSLGTETTFTDIESQKPGAYLVQIVPDNKSEYYRISPYSREIVISYSQESLVVGDVPELVAVELINTFGDEIDQYLSLYKRHSKSKTANDQEDNKSSNMVVAAHSPEYHITFSLLVQGGEPVSWDIAKALKVHFSSFEKELSKYVANFTIDTQVQFYSTLTHLPQKVETGADSALIKEYYIFSQDDLSTFVNFAEWSLSSIHSYPSLNFILYIPDIKYTPLLVRDKLPLLSKDNNPGATKSFQDAIQESKIKEISDNSFIIPQWGGVIIYNDPEVIQKKRNATTDPLHLNSDNLGPILEVFTSQLLTLLGAPKKPNSPVFKIDILSRLFTLRSLFDAAASLGSLTRLSISLPTIAIPKTVQSNVESALSDIDKTLRALKQEKWPDAVYFAAQASKASQKAFFEKMMVQQMYYPDEHKIAVYLPLMGPVLVVIIMSLLRVLKNWRQSKKENSNKDK